ncbi:hypothetical protein M1413_03430 [Patescibacteria group bacterium]|nr:hypothetical protein [Patescibacteria group bacterium]MCL5114243.1 hypothetical protein [Patescibacteria group bacterium]
MILRGDTLEIGYCSSTPTRDAAVYTAKRIAEMIATKLLPGGEMIKIKGPMPSFIATILTYKLAPFYEAIACFDFKTKKYIVAVARERSLYSVGDIIE